MKNKNKNYYYFPPYSTSFCASPYRACCCYCLVLVYRVSRENESVVLRTAGCLCSWVARRNPETSVLLLLLQLKLKRGWAAYGCKRVRIKRQRRLASCDCVTTPVTHPLSVKQSNYTTPLSSLSVLPRSRVRPSVRLSVGPCSNVINSSRLSVPATPPLIIHRLNDTAIHTRSPAITRIANRRPTGCQWPSRTSKNHIFLFYLKGRRPMPLPISD